MLYNSSIHHIDLRLNEQFLSSHSTNRIQYEIDTFGYFPWVMSFEKYTEWCEKNLLGRFFYYEIIESNPFTKNEQDLYLHESWYGIAFENANDALLFKLTCL